MLLNFHRTSSVSLLIVSHHWHLANKQISPIYTICFDRHVSKQTKRHIAHTRVYTVCLTELSLNFPLQNNFLCLHNLNMEEDNFVIPACMLVIAAFCLINMNLSVSDGVKHNSSFLLFLQNPQPSGQVFHRNRNPSMTCYFLYLYYLFLKDCRHPGKIARVPMCCL